MSKTAEDILNEAAAVMNARASQRDVPKERSMARIVTTFNALTGKQLSEHDGWMFMVVLKLARASNGKKVNIDDYLDGAAYIALAGECAQDAEKI